VPTTGWRRSTTNFIFLFSVRLIVSVEIDNNVTRAMIMFVEQLRSCLTQIQLLILLNSAPKN
jgi:hypothetical protein